MLRLFTSKACPNCEILKRKLKEKNLEYQEFDIIIPDNLAEFYFYNNKNRLSTPLLIEVDDKDNYVDDITDTI